jgi:uncharacterized protein YceH (UPF0502 family)
MDLDAVQVRVLGCLIEKQRTTPDAYPLSLNGLRLACNQTTNRDPVVEYDEPTIREAIAALSRKGWVRLASGAGSRAVKYRHLLDRELDVSAADLAVLAVLLLRGPQTPGELKQRTERLHAFEGLEDVETTLMSLVERELVARQGRRPGQKEERFAQLLGESGTSIEAASTYPAEPARLDRIGELELRVERLEQSLRALREELGAEPAAADPQA